MKQERMMLNRNNEQVIAEVSKGEKDLPELILDPVSSDWQQLQMLNSERLQRVVVPLGAVTEKLFQNFNNEDHASWLECWNAIEQTVKITGPGKVFVILFAGLGETEQQLAQCCQKICDLGAEPTLLSLADDTIRGRKATSIGRYRRMQMIRYLIAEEISDADSMQFNEFGTVFEFGIPKRKLTGILQEARPFFKVGTGAIDPADYEWPGHDNTCGNIRNFSPEMSEEQKTQVRNEFSLIAWGEEWSTVANMLKNCDTDLNELIDDEEELPLKVFSDEDLRYLS